MKGLMLSVVRLGLISIALMTLSMVTAISIRAEETTCRVVNVAPNDVLNIREYPSNQSRIIDIIPPASRGIKCFAKTVGDWVLVRHERAEGWAYNRYLVREMPSGRPFNQTAGWWVVVGSFSVNRPEEMSAERESITTAVGRCGLQTFNDFSAKFRGFAPGFNVFLVGPYASRVEADQIVILARRCIPDAYVKYGEYAGE
jgi:hypothetical protein